MKTTIIPNCKDFTFFRDAFFIISKEGVLFRENNKIHESNFSFRGETEYGIWLFDETNFETYIYGEKGNLINRISGYGVTLRKQLSENIWLVGINDGVNIFSADYDVVNFKIIKKHLKLGFNGVNLLYNDCFISRNKSKIGLFNFNNKCIWERDYTEIISSEKAYTSHKTLLFDNKLFLTIQGGDSGGLVCLNADNGDVIDNFPNLNYEIFSNDKIIYTTCFENRLCQINTSNYKISEWNVNEIIKGNGFESIHDHRCTVSEQKFYFTQTLGDIKAKLGVLDWDKKELIFKHEFLPENGGVAGIQINKSKILIKMQDDSLHIFEE